MIKYFREPLNTLKSIDESLRAIRLATDRLKNCTTTRYSSGSPSIRTAGPHD